MKTCKVVRGGEGFPGKPARALSARTDPQEQESLVLLAP
jgi:hypothetical protein